MIIETVENARYAERTMGAVARPILLLDINGETLAMTTDQRIAHYGVATFFPLPEYGSSERANQYKAILLLDPETDETGKPGKPWTQTVNGATTDQRVVAAMRRFAYDVREGNFRPGQKIPVVV